MPVPKNASGECKVPKHCTPRTHCKVRIACKIPARFLQDPRKPRTISHDLARSRTISDELVPFEIVCPDVAFAEAHLLSTPAAHRHRWYVYPEMTVDECLIFVSGDTAREEEVEEGSKSQAVMVLE